MTRGIVREVGRALNRLLAPFGLELRRISPDVSPHQYSELLKLPRYQPATIRLLGEKFEIADGKSFFYSYKEIFSKQIYLFATESPSPFIVDCGSNVGTSVVFFKTLYPQARVVGVEADPALYSLLVENCKTRRFSDVKLMNRAVSSRSGVVEFSSEGADAGRIGTLPLSGTRMSSVETVPLDELISEPVDFLKVDIEGAETEAFSASRKLGMVRSLFVEYHSMLGQDQTLHILLEKLVSEGFRYFVQEQMCSPRPLVEERSYLGMDLQLNIFAIRDRLVTGQRIAESE